MNVGKTKWKQKYDINSFQVNRTALQLAQFGIGGTGMTEFFFSEVNFKTSNMF